MTEARRVEDLIRDPRTAGEIQRALDALERTEVSASARVHVLRNFTLENACGALKVAGYRRGVKLDLSLSDFDAYRQDALVDASGDLGRADVVMLWLWLESLRPAFDVTGRLDVDAALREVFEVAASVGARSSATVLVHTFLPPIGGGHDWKDHDALDRLNAEIRARVAADPRLALVDTARIAASIGFESAVDVRFSLVGAAPLSLAFARAWSEVAAQAIASRRGRVRKVIVVDADNTLWGGVVGEDGIEGIKLSTQSYPGNAFRLFHQQLLELRSRGVILAIASKNDPEAVFEVLDRHPASLLKREHFAVTRIGWGQKSDSVSEIARELNVGLDSVVFVDDSAFECEEVARALPMVETVRVPKDAFRIPAVLSSLRLFDDRPATREDALRAGHYDSERARDEARAGHSDIDSFLGSLSLEAKVGAPSAQEIERIAQLTQRTNQFNLTTRRRDAGEIAAMCANDRFVVLGLRATDRYGDYGLVGLAIAEVAISEGGGSTARIDTLLMSCRALGRKLDDVLLSELLDAIELRAPGAVVFGEFIGTAKNGQVSAFYDLRGFAPMDGVFTRADLPRVDSPQVEASMSRKYYRLADRGAVSVPTYIGVKRIRP